MKTKFILIAVILMLAGGVFLLLPKMAGIRGADGKDSRTVSAGELQDGHTGNNLSALHKNIPSGPGANPPGNTLSLPPNDLVTEAMQSGDEEQVLTACFAQYKETNPETVGIITIPGTVLCHPLMKSKSNEGFYLNHDLLGNRNSNGVPFLSRSSRLNKPGSNAVIYGHNIRYGAKDVFYPLSGYEKLDYYLAHPLIEIYGEGGKEEYLVFAYYLVDTADEDAFVYWEKTSFDAQSDFEQYLTEVERRNWLKTSVPTGAEDEYITLSSCSMELAHSGTNRMVVMARKIRPGEEPEDYLEGACLNTHPYLPKKLRTDAYNIY